MAVIDELIIIENGESKVVDSADNGIIDEIEVENNIYHFAKESEAIGTCDNAVEEPIIDLKISGNSVQDGTPTPETPIEIESVGERTINLWNKPNGTYRPRVDITLKAGTQITISQDSIETLEINYADGTAGTIPYGSNMRWYTNEKGRKYNTLTLAKDVSSFMFRMIPTNPMLVIGTATEYEPYGKYKVPIKVNDTTTNIYLNEPLRKIGDYADYIDYKNKKIVRKITKKIFNGTESWVLHKASVCAFYCNYIESGYINSNTIDNICFCNRFVHNNQTNLYTGTIGIAFRGEDFKRMYITFGENSSINTLDLLKDWMFDNNLEVLYLSNTPTEEAIEIEEIATSKGTNNFVAETTILPSEIKINYWKQI